VATERDPWLDNVKVLTIFLVVLGHGLDFNDRNDGLALAGFNFLYFFHIPLFAMVSGWFVSKAPTGFEAMRRSVGQLLVPYIVFQFVYVVVFAAADADYSLRVVVPGYGIWYLLSLFCWRLLAPWFMGNRFGIPAAIGVAIAAGYTTEISTVFSLSRTLVFFPAFLLGARYSGQIEVTLRQRGVRPAAVVAVGVAALVAVATRGDIDRSWIYGNVGYAEIESLQWWAGAWRALVLFAGLVLALAVASLVPHRRLWVTSFGRHTLYAYLLHLVIRQAIRAFDLFPTTVDPRVLTLWIVVVSLVLTFLLMSRPVRALTRAFVEPLRFFGSVRARFA